MGNAYGSNITDIALNFGFSAFIRPIAVNSRVLRGRSDNLNRPLPEWRKGMSPLIDPNY
jgi:hypothetical protein